jgi:hypothetical protein
MTAYRRANATLKDYKARRTHIRIVAVEHARCPGAVSLAPISWLTTAYGTRELTERLVSVNISGEYHSGNHARVIQAPAHAQAPHMVHKFPAPESPSGASGHKAGQVRPRNDHPARDVGTLDGSMVSPTGGGIKTLLKILLWLVQSPTGERMASEATAARKRDSATVDATIRQDTADTSRTLHSKPQSAEVGSVLVTSQR